MHSLLSQPSNVGAEAIKPSIHKGGGAIQLRTAGALLVPLADRKLSRDEGANFQQIFDGETDVPNEEQLSIGPLIELAKAVDPVKATAKILPRNQEVETAEPKFVRNNFPQEYEDLPSVERPAAPLLGHTTVPNTTPKIHAEADVKQSNATMRFEHPNVAQVITSINVLGHGDSRADRPHSQQENAPTPIAVQRPVVPHHFGWAVQNEDAKPSLMSKISELTDPHASIEKKQTNASTEIVPTVAQVGASSPISKGEMTKIADPMLVRAPEKPMSAVNVQTPLEPQPQITASQTSLNIPSRSIQIPQQSAAMNTLKAAQSDHKPAPDTLGKIDKSAPDRTQIIPMTTRKITGPQSTSSDYGTMRATSGNPAMQAASANPTMRAASDPQIGTQSLFFDAALFSPSDTAHASTVPHGTDPARTNLPVHIARQLAEIAQHMPTRPVEITLNPEELGRVRLSVTPAENSIVVNILAERSETLDLMRRHIDQLTKEFESLGYDDIGFSFSQTGDETTDDQNEHSTENDPQDAATDLSRDADQSTHIHLSTSAATGLDLRL